MHGAMKVMCSMCEEKGTRGSEDRPTSESPDSSRVATPKCKMGTASHSEGTVGAPTIDFRYPENEYAVPVPLNAVSVMDYHVFIPIPIFLPLHLLLSPRHLLKHRYCISL